MWLIRFLKTLWYQTLMKYITIVQTFFFYIEKKHIVKSIFIIVSLRWYRILNKISNFHMDSCTLKCFSKNVINQTENVLLISKNNFWNSCFGFSVCFFFIFLHTKQKKSTKILKQPLLQSKCLINNINLLSVEISSLT